MLFMGIIILVIRGLLNFYEWSQEMFIQGLEAGLEAVGKIFDHPQTDGINTKLDMSYYIFAVAIGLGSAVLIYEGNYVGGFVWILLSAIYGIWSVLAKRPGMMKKFGIWWNKINERYLVSYCETTKEGQK